jgi:hypothetical protein
MGSTTTPMESTTTPMKSTSATETASAARRSKTLESPAAAHRGAAAESTVKSVPSASIESWAAAVERPATVESASAIVATAEPRTRANKYAPGKIIRAVITVRRACVRGIPIVAICACRAGPHIGWAILNRNLRVGRPRHNHEKPEQNNIF